MLGTACSETIASAIKLLLFNPPAPFLHLHRQWAPSLPLHLGPARDLEASTLALLQFVDLVSQLHLLRTLPVHPSRNLPSHPAELPLLLLLAPPVTLRDR